MKYYPIKCLHCSGLFVGVEPKDDYVCDDCLADAPVKKVVTTHFECPSCHKIYGIKAKHDKQYRCGACISKRGKAMVASNKKKKEWRMAEEYRISVYGKDGGVK